MHTFIFIYIDKESLIQITQQIVSFYMNKNILMERLRSTTRKINTSNDYVNT